MPEVSIDALQEAIRHTHGCESRFVETVPVTERFQGQTVWEGKVQVFDLIAHPTATRCYAWSYLIGDTERRRIVAVLHEGPVDSAQAAVRAAIIAENRDQPD